MWVWKGEKGLQVIITSIYSWINPKIRTPYAYGSRFYFVGKWICKCSVIYVLQY